MIRGKKEKISDLGFQLLQRENEITALERKLKSLESVKNEVEQKDAELKLTRSQLTATELKLQLSEKQLEAQALAARQQLQTHYQGTVAIGLSTPSPESDNAEESNGGGDNVDDKDFSAEPELKKQRSKGKFKRTKKNGKRGPSGAGSATKHIDSQNLNHYANESNQDDSVDNHSASESGSDCGYDSTDERDGRGSLRNKNRNSSTTKSLVDRIDHDVHRVKLEQALFKYKWKYQKLETEVHRIYGDNQALLAIEVRQKQDIQKLEKTNKHLSTNITKMRHDLQHERDQVHMLKRSRPVLEVENMKAVDEVVRQKTKQLQEQINQQEREINLLDDMIKSYTHCLIFRQPWIAEAADYGGSEAPTPCDDYCESVSEGQTGQTGQSQTGNSNIVMIPILQLRFTHRRINSQMTLQNKKSIYEVFDSLQRGKMRIESDPLFVFDVVWKNGVYYSINNRRLFVALMYQGVHRNVCIKVQCRIRSEGFDYGKFGRALDWGKPGSETYTGTKSGSEAPQINDGNLEDWGLGIQHHEGSDRNSNDPNTKPNVFRGNFARTHSYHNNFPLFNPAFGMYDHLVKVLTGTQWEGLLKFWHVVNSSKPNAAPSVMSLVFEDPGDLNILSGTGSGTPVDNRHSQSGPSWGGYDYPKNSNKYEKFNSKNTINHNAGSGSGATGGSAAVADASHPTLKGPRSSSISLTSNDGSKTLTVGNLLKFESSYQMRSIDEVVEAQAKNNSTPAAFAAVASAAKKSLSQLDNEVQVEERSGSHGARIDGPGPTSQNPADTVHKSKSDETPAAHSVSHKSHSDHNHKEKDSHGGQCLGHTTRSRSRTRHKTVNDKSRARSAAASASRKGGHGSVKSKTKSKTSGKRVLRDSDSRSRKSNARSNRKSRSRLLHKRSRSRSHAARSRNRSGSGFRGERSGRRGGSRTRR